jgi:hypothetical protein
MRYQSPARSRTSSTSPRFAVATIALAVLGSLRTFTRKASTCTESAQPLPAARERVRTSDAIARSRVDMNLLP